MRTIWGAGAAICLSMGLSAAAQMSVHAVTGTVKAITPQAMRVEVEPGTTTEFKLAPDAKVAVDFAGDLRADTVKAGAFRKVGDFVLVYFYGYGNQRTALAVKDLGAGSYAKVDGTVVAFDKHDRKLTIADQTGKRNVYVLGDHLIVDSDEGAGNGRHYSPHKGDQLRLTYSSTGSPAAVAFLRPSV